MASPRDLLAPLDTFERRHNGSPDADVALMLQTVGHASLDALADAAVPANIRLKRSLRLPAAASETTALAELRAIAAKNRIFRSHIGMGYHDTATPGVIQRNILENPGWYTAYTPYQAEISQGRLEALLNFQTLVTDLTGLQIANASMLDEGTAAAEAMMMCHRVKLGESHDQLRFFVSDKCHPQTIDIVRTRAKPLGIESSPATTAPSISPGKVFGVLVQYPDTTGSIHDFTRVLRQGPRRRRAHRRRHRPARAHASPRPGRVRRRCRRRLRPALRRADGLRRPARRVSSPPRTPSSARCPAASSACRRTSTATRPCASPSARASNTSAATRPRPTSAPPRSSSASWRRCMPSTTVPRASSASHSARVKLLTQLLADGLKAAGARVNAEPVFDTLTVTGVAAAACTPPPSPRRSQPAPPSTPTPSASPSTRPPRSPKSRPSLALFSEVDVAAR
jgi:glycine dehydrogenase